MDFLANLAKRTLPAEWVQFIRCCRYRGVRRHLSYSFKLKALHKQFLRSNGATSDTEFALSPHVLFNIDPRARHAFEHFTHLEPDMVEEMAVFLHLTTASRCLLDVGALYGIFSLAFTSRRGTIAFAFEPNPDSFEILSSNVDLNPALQIHPENIAVGETERPLRMHSGFHLMVVPEGQSPTGEFTTVQARSLDAFISYNRLNPDVLKIDVEGYEASVLAGAKGLLQENRPLLFLEIHPASMRDHGHNPADIYEHLIMFGYQLFDTNLRPVGVRFFKRPDIFRIIASYEPIRSHTKVCDNCV